MYLIATETITGFGDLIGNFGFPIAVVAVLMVFVTKLLKSYKDTFDSQKADIKELNDRYHADYIIMSEAINNNTNAINMLSKLVEHVTEDKNDDNFG